MSAPPESRQQPAAVQKLVDNYRRRAEEFAAHRASHRRRSNLISNLRVAAFVLAVVFVLAAWRLEWFPPVSYTAAALSFALFVGLIVYQRRVRARIRRATLLRARNLHDAARVLRDWEHVPRAAAPAGLRLPPIAHDLDLFGEASLFQLLCHAQTAPGRRLLADWLLHPADPAEIPARQQAVDELAPRLDWRQELAFLGTPEDNDFPSVEPFLAWAEGEAWLRHRPALRLIGFGMPLLAVVLIVLNLTDLWSQNLWLVVLLANVGLSLFYAPKIHAIFARVSSRRGEIQRYAKLLQFIATTNFESDRLRQLHDELQTAGYHAHRQIGRLRRLMDLADLRYSQLYIVIQAATLWDIHVLAAVERWQRDVGRHVRRWFESLSQFEALASLASLRHDNPDWCFPTVAAPDTDISKNSDALCIVAERLAHPLLPPAAAVANDCRVGPPAAFTLVTGSNMSGKSTFLRAVGTAAVLAQAGAPTPAARLTLPPLTVETSMRVEDSLESGVSFFMAELKRLKQIVDSAQDAAQTSGRVFLYLLDEILQGTNSVERQIAVRRVLEHLLEQRAIGLISTHDLALADEPRLAAAADPVHFRETIDGAAARTMTFDYQLRSGLATTTNALRLLELVGLSDENTAKENTTAEDSRHLDSPR